MKFRKDFIGLDGFVWWVGVVENRQDPLGLGRCQVRVFGFHDKDLIAIPSEDLPWAQPVHALNNQTFSTPKEGEYVFGFFLDGKFAQQPIMMGIIPGIPAVEYPSTDGFTDQRTEDLLSASPRKPSAIQFKTDGTGASIEEKEAASRNPENIDEPTNSRLARNEGVKDTVIALRRKNVIKDIPTAGEETWDEPFPAYNAKYPYNKVMETESGHVLELDDTPKAERIHFAHRSGTFEEVYPTGTKVEKIVKNNYQLILSDNHLYVAGKVNITVLGDSGIKVVGDVTIEGNNNLNAGIAKDVNLTVGGDFNVKATNIKLETTADTNIKSAASIKLDAASKIDVKSGSKFVASASGIDLDGATVTKTLTASVLNSNSLNTGTTNLKAKGKDTGSNGGSDHNLDVSGSAAGSATPSSADSAEATGLDNAPASENPNISENFIEQTPADRAAYFLDAGEVGIEDYIQEQIDKGIYSQEEIAAGNNPTEGAKDETPPPNLKGTTDCEGVDQLTSFPDSLQLSQKFTLGQLTGKAPCGDPLKEQRGLSKAEIVCNLKLLAVNCLDKIKEKYPSALITNAFRYPTGKAAGKSQHEIGQAADIQFPGVSKSGYYDIALWIRDNVPHDQLLLEYKTTGTGMPWIHISYKKDQRPPGPNKNMTVMNHKTYKPFFINLA